MKKLIYLIFIVLIGFCFGFNSSPHLKVLARQNIAGGDCPSGTYKFYWDGDHPSGTDYACVDSGASTQQAAAVTSIVISAVGYSGNGVTIDADNSFIEWAITADDIIDDAIGTVWFRIYIPSAITADCLLFEATKDVENAIVGYTVTADGELWGRYRVAATTYNANSGSALTTGSWITIGYAWDQVNDDHSVYDGSAWSSDDNDGISAGLPVPTTLRIGESVAGGAACTPDPIIDEFYVFSTYKTASPF